MMQLMKKAVTLSFVGLLAVFSLGLHLNFLQPSPSHTMDGMSHSFNSSTSCVTACNSATLQKDDYLSEHQSDKDDEPEPPFYSLLQLNSLTAIEKQHSQKARLVAKQPAPPGGLPAYIVLSVFRT